MARIRSVKPEFWNDRKLARLSRDARLLFIALWNLSDEHGRLQGDARFIKGHCLPYDDDLDLDAVEGLLDELAEHGRVQRYEHEGDPYLFLPTLAKHQRLDSERQPSRLPPPPPAEKVAEPTEKSADCADKVAEPTGKSEEVAAKQVAGSRLQVAGDVAQEDPPRGRQSDPTDADHLCDYFVSAISKNGVKATISERWRTEARLLLDRDKRPPEEVRAVITWATSDTFWKANILSIPKLREKYDQLRLAMEREQPEEEGDPDKEYLRTWNGDGAPRGGKRPAWSLGAWDV
jgi:hypothetical protein